MTDQTLPQSRGDEGNAIQRRFAELAGAATLQEMMRSASHEALARWVLKNLDWSGGNSDENAEFLAAILERAASVPSETKAKWRPVSEKPPCANQYIALIALPDCDEPRVAQRYYSMTGKWDSDYVTHWMPFPEAP